MKNTVQPLCNQRYNAIFSQPSRSQALVFPISAKNNSASSNSKAGCLGELVQVQDSHSAFCLSWQFGISYGGLPLPHRTSCTALPRGFLELPASKKDYHSFISSNFFEKQEKSDLGHICLFPNQCLQLWDQVPQLSKPAYSSPSHCGWEEEVL